MQASLRLQPFQPHLHELAQRGKLGAQHPQAYAGNAIRTAALFDRHVMELAVSGYPFVFLGRYPLNPEVTAVGIDDIGGAAIAADIASMRHETQYTRLFRS